MPGLKGKLQYVLQQLLGYRSYLYVFARFKIATLRWDRKENDFFRFLTLLPPKGIYLDIGANLGIMTYFLSKHDPHSEVWAIEPEPRNFEALNRVVRACRLKNVRLFSVALGEAPGEVELVVPVVGHVRKQGLSHVVHEELTDFTEGEKVPVSMQTLDTLVADASLPIRGIKLDVENFEYFVLRGGEHVLRTHRPVVYTELWENANRTRCLDWMQSLGYQTLVAEGDQLIPFDATRHRMQNFFFQYPES